MANFWLVDTPAKRVPLVKEDEAPVGTASCMHAHVGFLAQGQIHMEFPDGCVLEFRAPQVVAIEPGHDGWVVGDQSAVLIEFDFGGETAGRFIAN